MEGHMQCCGKPLGDIEISLGVHYRGIEYKIREIHVASTSLPYSIIKEGYLGLKISSDFFLTLNSVVRFTYKCKPL